MKSNTIFFASSLFAFLAFAVGCSSSATFGYASLEEAILGLPEGTDVVTVVDTNDDGIPDGIDTNNDGTVDVVINPPTGTTPETPTGDDPVLRDSEGDCIVLGTTRTVIGDFSSNAPGADNLVISDIASSTTVVTIDLQGATVKRVVLNSMTGSRNRLEVKNAVMTEGFCNNKLSGGSNQIRLQASNSSPLVDLASGSGNRHDFDTLFKPTSGLKYNLSGFSHCISVVPGTTILSAVSNDGEHRILDDGSSVCIQ